MAVSGSPAASPVALVLVVGCSLVCGPAPAAVVTGKTHARISVTVDPDENGTILVPSPFAVVPGSDRVLIHVPESGGIFLLEGERILHHYPLVPDGGVLHDMSADEDTFVAARHAGEGFVTVQLWVFDLRTGRSVGSTYSKNPYLRPDFGSEGLWRALVEGDRVGIFHPGTGASYPLWERGTGVLPSSDQMAGASAGIGFSGDVKWIPEVDGTVRRWSRGRTVEFVDADRGEFLDPVGDHAVLLAQPEPTVRADADGDLLLAPELGVRLVQAGGVETDFRLRSLSSDVRAKRLVMQGRAVRVRGGRIYWIYLGYDFLEIRTVPVTAIPGLPAETEAKSTPGE